MEQKILEDIQNIKYILKASISLKEKYFQIKSLERSLLEYILLKDHLSLPHGHQISNAAEFIHSYFLIENIWDEFNKFEGFASLTLATLEIILNSPKKRLDEIQEFCVYEIYFSNLQQTLARV